MDQDIFLNNINNGLSEEASGTEALEDRMTVGQKLSEARLKSPVVDLEKISDELCIRPHLLHALEGDDFDKFPSACYAAGFLKNYSSYLGLNVTQIVAQYKDEFQGSAKKVDLVFLEVEKNYNHSQHLIVSLVILSALVLYGVWYSSSGNKSLSLSALPDVTAVTSSILVSATGDDQKSFETKALLTKDVSEQNQGFHLVQPVNATPLVQEKTISPATTQVRLSVAEDTWIRVVSSDRQILVDRIFLAGEEFYMTERKDMTLMTSNAGAVSLFVGDVAVSLLGKSGEIRDNISLNRQDLLTITAQLSP